MTFTFKTASIIFSLVLAGLMIIAAYILSGGNPLGLRAANAGTTDELLKTYAAKDTDSDGLPDWQEALYGTNPNDAHSVDPKLTDKEAVDTGAVKPKYSATPTTSSTPGVTKVEGPNPAHETLTGQFSQFLFTEYLTKRGAAPMTKEQINTFVEDAVGQFFAVHKRLPIYTLANVTVNHAGTAGLPAYAASVEQSLANEHVSTTKGEISYFSDAITKNDAAALKKVKEIGAAYTALGQLYIKVSPPQEAAAAHLAIANAFAQLGTVITDISTIQEDPVRGMYGLNAYEKSAVALAQALSDMGNIFTKASVSIPSGQPGAKFFSATTGIAAGKETL